MTDIVEVHLPPRMDSRTSADAERAALAAIQPAGAVIVRADSVVYMSAAGIRALATLTRAAKACGARVAFTGFGVAATECLEGSGFAAVLPTFGSLDQARRAVVSDRSRPD